MFQVQNHSDRQAKYPEVVTTRVPTELREAVKQIAAKEHVSMHEFIRCAIGERVERLSADRYKHSALAYVVGA
jgi:predicted HicB family RNase H-like nuclease